MLPATRDSKNERAQRFIEDQGPRDLDLAHRELPEVAGLAISFGEGCREDRDPAVEEALEVGRTQTDADRLEGHIKGHEDRHANKNRWRAR